MAAAKQLGSGLPDQELVALARESASELSKLLASHPDIARARVHLDDTDMVLPRQALDMLRDLLSEMAQGHAVTLVPTHQQLTTQQAADILNVSRPYLIKLLKAGDLPFTEVGRHRRIRLQDLLEYKTSRDKQSQKAMDDLARQAQELDMGY